MKKIMVEVEQARAIGRFHEEDNGGRNSSGTDATRKDDSRIGTIQKVLSI